MKHRTRRRAKKFSMPEVSLTPLIDVALTLLVIFMIAAPMIQHNAKVVLPKGNSIDEKHSDPELSLVLMNDGTLFFNNERIEKKEVVPILKSKIGNRENVSVYIAGDEKVAYGSVMEIFDMLKSASIDSVILSLRST